MSSLKKQEPPAIVATPAPVDYKPQHPMHEWRPTVATAESDHLDEYTEVNPFEDTEGKKKGLLTKAKDKLRKRKMKGAAKKVRKLIPQIGKTEKKIRQIRAKQKDTEAFDTIVTKKLDEEDKEIYREATN
jgi:hypothetical protein